MLTFSNRLMTFVSYLGGGKSNIMKNARTTPLGACPQGRTGSNRPEPNNPKYDMPSLLSNGTNLGKPTECQHWLMTQEKVHTPN